MEKFPYFVCRVTNNGKHVKYRTKTPDGKLIEVDLWNLINKFGADKVLQMRKELPEVEENDDDKR